MRRQDMGRAAIAAKPSTPPTALHQALADKGYVKLNVEFSIACSKFQNGGGEFGVAYALLCASYGRSEGQPPIGGHARHVDADAAPGAGQASGADKANTRLVSPGHARRGAAAIGSVQASLSRSLFDSIILPDGRPLRDVRWSECPILAARYLRLSRILLACRNYAIPSDPTSSLADVVPDDVLQQIVNAAETLNAPN